MLDLISIVATGALFGIAITYIHACTSLIRAKGGRS
jgi:hypothetical protein